MNITQARTGFLKSKVIAKDKDGKLFLNDFLFKPSAISSIAALIEGPEGMTGKFCNVVIGGNLITMAEGIMDLYERISPYLGFEMMVDENSCK